MPHQREGMRTMQAGSVATAVLSEGRYARHSLVGGWDQGAIGRATAVVAGAGALGNEAIKLLAMMGVGHLVIVDPDTVEETNLSRTVLFRAADIGLPKAEVAARRARELNPAVQVRAIVGDVTSDLGLGDLARATMVLGCLDSALARWLFNRRCLAAGVEWIDGGTGERHGQVARYGPSGGACFECAMTPRTFERLEKRYRCGFHDAQASAGPAMPSTRTLSSTIAAIQVQEALHVAMGVEQPVGLRPGQRLSVYLRPYQLFVDDLLVAESSGLRRTLRQPRKEGGGEVPLITPAPGKDLQAYGTIVRDTRLGRYVMFMREHMGGGGFFLATSSDGLEIGRAHV